MIPAEAERAFWLDGGGSTRWSGRRTIVGVLDDDDVSLTFDAARREVTRHQGGRSEVVGDDIFDALREGLDGDPDTHWVGVLGYASRSDLPGRPTGLDAVWMRSRRVQVTEGRVLKWSPGRPPEHSTPPTPTYREAFDRVQEELRAGNSYEVNLTHRVGAHSDADPLEVYERLRAANPAPYAGYLRHHGTHLVSASPERFVTIDRHRWIETRPIKGTTPRGDTPDEDAAQARLLATDPKIRAENLMIADLLRNDLAMVCEPGTVVVPQLMQVESYASVHQLVTTVRGRLRDDVDTIGALRAIFPAGSMTGAPKLRTMQIIDAVEETPRGLYAGAFGWISGDGRADLGVVIRSLVRDPAGEWVAGSGGGITVRSEVGAEWAEAGWKAARVLSALEGS